MIQLVKGLWLWFNKYVTIVLVAVGSSLFAVAMSFLSKIPCAGGLNVWWLHSAFIAIASAISAYSMALFREWRGDGKEGIRKQERIKREMANSWGVN
ncbi:MAG: hypothetical protein ACOC6R_01090 [Chloroflexota bacterium]